MPQTTISRRRRPCHQCGGRYFASTYSVISVLIALIAAFGGIAKAVIGSGAFTASGAPAVETLLGHVAWALGGMVIAAIVLVIGHGYRCIKCDTQQ